MHGHLKGFRALRLKTKCSYSRAPHLEHCHQLGH
jgi:hypothetical protein